MSSGRHASRDVVTAASGGCAARGSWRLLIGTGCRALVIRSFTHMWSRQTDPGGGSLDDPRGSRPLRAQVRGGRGLPGRVARRGPRAAALGLVAAGRSRPVRDRGCPRGGVARVLPPPGEIEERALALTGVEASKLGRDRLQGIALATRKAKEYGVDGARWRAEAKARAAEYGLGGPELDRLVSSRPRFAATAEADVVRKAAGRLSGPEG
jgi:hypothetical protein